MAKAPRPGMVKTRLSATLPSDAVTELYRCLLGDTLTMAQRLHDVQVAIVCPDSDQEELSQLAGSSVRVVAQSGRGLAAGLTSVFQHFTSAGCQHVIAFNSDSPHLAPSVLQNAFELLNSQDVVIGPTYDGGYYLVGAKAPHPLFEGDGMGTGSALERLLARTRALELSTGFTEPFYDIDVAKDLVRLNGELLLAPGKAPLTAAWFSNWTQVIAPLSTEVGEL